MQIIRTILGFLILVGIVLFSVFNWKPVEVMVWQGLLLETKVPVLVIASFLLGMIPMWLLHRGSAWSLNRRINTLEDAVRSAARPADPSPNDPALSPEKHVD